jgi:DNA-binding NtrC family response regulator
MISVSDRFAGKLWHITCNYWRVMTAMKSNIKTILLLEEDRELANSIRMYLEDTYRVYVVQYAEKFTQFIKQHNVDLVVTELDFPCPNFQKLLHNLKETRPDIKIVIMYMFFDRFEHDEKSIMQEADDYIFKPFDADVLRHKLDRLANHA